jgi:ankyrin repeat protein
MSVFHNCACRSCRCLCCRAPNGYSALMLAASVDCAEGVQLLLDSAASLELQDALGRTALMFAAGNNACQGLEVLLDRGASVSIRDRCAMTALRQQ